MSTSGPHAKHSKGRRPVSALGTWLVTGAVGRGLAFAIDFAAAVRRGLLGRRA